MLTACLHSALDPRTYRNLLNPSWEANAMVSGKQPFMRHGDSSIPEPDPVVVMVTVPFWFHVPLLAKNTPEWGRGGANLMVSGKQACELQKALSYPQPARMQTALVPPCTYCNLMNPCCCWW